MYGLAGVGLVLTYRTSGVFNFGYGGVATAAAYLFYVLHVNHHVAWPIAAFIAVPCLGALLGLAFERLGQALAPAPLATRVVATVGVFLVVVAGATIMFGTNARSLPPFLPVSTIEFGGAFIGWDQLIITVVAAVTTILLYLYLRLSRVGVAMRGVVDDPELLALSGTRPIAVRRVAWIVGTTFACLCGVLLAPSIGLQPAILTLLVIQAFGAGAVGGFVSLPVTFLGGLGIGIASALLTKEAGTNAVLAGLPAGLPFIVLFVALLVMSKPHISGRAAPVGTFDVPPSVPLVLRRAAVAVAVVLLLVAPRLLGVRLDALTSGLATAILLLSLGLLVRISGQVSLCQVSFAAVGAVAMSHLGHGIGLPWPLALVLAGLVAVPVGAFVAIPAIRLSGLHLALATFGFAMLLQQMFYGTSWMFTSFAQGIAEPRPHLGWVALDTRTGYYYVVLAIFAAMAVVAVAVTRSRLGRLLRGLNDSALGLTMSGAEVNVTKVLVFCISAFMAGISGALTGGLYQNVAGLNFDPLTSLTLLAAVVIAVGAEPWYVLPAAAGLGVIPAYWSSGNASEWLALLFGGFAVLFSIVVPQRRRRLAPSIETMPSTTNAPAGSVSERVAAVELIVDRVVVKFGGVVALDGVSLSVPTGRVTGLIGPNGAGKTTTFNASCGIVPIVSGTVKLGGRDITKLTPAARARAGLGRTFQQTELFDSLSVVDNVALGREALFAGANPISHLAARRPDKAAVRRAAADALEVCGLGSLSATAAADLSTGQRRLVEFARCLAGGYSIVLLDEPSAGLDRSETEMFGEVVRGAVRDHGIGVLLVEHDISLVSAVCEYVYVLDFGVPLFDGSTDDVLSSREVRDAYLGDGFVPTAVQAAAES